MHCVWTFNLLGEPEMPIWTDTPKIFTVTHPDIIPIGTSSFTVHVENSTAPVNQAYVCLWKGEEVYEREYTDATGDAVLTVSPATDGEMYVTVTKHNYLPYEGGIEVTQFLGSTNPASEGLENERKTMGVAEGSSDTPAFFSFGLRSNPVRGKAVFNLALPRGGLVTLRIYDVSGRLIDKVISGKQAAGYYDIPWVSKVGAGVYFYSFESSWKTKIGKLVFVR